MSVQTIDPPPRHRIADSRPVRQSLHLKSGFREFVIIVLGVLTALAADAIRKSYIDRATQREYIARLADELTRGRDRIVYNRDRNAAAFHAVDTLLARPAAITDTPAILRLVLRAADYEFNQAGVVHDNTYRELLSTGALSLLRDLDTRNSITTYYRLVYRVGDVVNESSDKTRELANRVRAATGESPAQLVEEKIELGKDTQARLLAMFAGRDIDDQLRYLRSRLHDRSIWMDRLLVGTDSVLRELNSK